LAFIVSQTAKIALFAAIAIFRAHVYFAVSRIGTAGKPVETGRLLVDAATQSVFAALMAYRDLILPVPAELVGERERAR